MTTGPRRPPEPLDGPADRDLPPPRAADPGEVLARLRGRQDEMTRLLRTLAELETPSRDPATHGPLLDVLARELRDRGFRTRTIPAPSPETGGHLFARTGRGEGPAQLLLGHLDTVWPVGTLESMPVRTDGGRMHGPGVFDMKAGLVQMLFAFTVLGDLGVEPDVEPAVLVTGDEEIGSPGSARWVRRLARRSCRAFVLEPSLSPAGALKTARKGTGRFEIRIEGRGSHAGLAPEEGASAIQELSHVIQALHAMSDAGREITLNVGEVEGGVRPNVVAPRARAVVDVRVPTREDARRIDEAIRSLEPTTPGTRVVVEGGMRRPPMERTAGNRRLWEAARRLGGELGLDLEQARAGGASDGNLTSLHVPTLDGLGAVGDGAHADHEHVVLERMPERSALLALLLLLPPAARRGDGGAPSAGPSPGG
jgi:glutamate carboxypeptidase